MLIIVEYEWKDYGIFFDISLYFPVCLKIFIRKTKMKEQSLHSQSNFKKMIYFQNTSIFHIMHTEKKISISFLHVYSLFLHVSVTNIYEPNIILMSHMWYFIYILPVFSKYNVLKILILSLFLKRNQFGNNYFDILYIHMQSNKNALA